MTRTLRYVGELGNGYDEIDKAIKATLDAGHRNVSLDLSQNADATWKDAESRITKRSVSPASVYLECR
jgi:hypothetical protein